MHATVRAAPAIRKRRSGRAPAHIFCKDAVLALPLGRGLTAETPITIVRRAREPGDPTRMGP
jgi:hypothetical protein